MHKLVISTLWLTVLTLSLPVMAATEAGRLTGGTQYTIPDWFKDSFLDIAEDAAEAGESERHVLLYMHLDDCPYCATMLQTSFLDPETSTFIQDNFDCIALNIKGDREVAMDADTTVSEKELSRLLQVRYTPTVIFLDPAGKPVLRLNGYRSPQGFRKALAFVSSRSYETTNLSDYIEAHSTEPLYAFRDNPQLVELSTLNDTGGKPLAVLFEDSACDECDLFHDTLLRDPQIQSLLEQFEFVRLDANSDTPITDPAGHRTTPRTWSRELGLTYRPGMVLFDQGREIARLDGMQKSFHFQRVLRFVAEDQYQAYPTFRDYARANQAELLQSGTSIDLWK